MAAALQPVTEPKYRIGTVVQLTGLTADSIRAWERRYGSVVPSRTAGGTRLYSEEDVARLQLMRALTELGNPIGSIANLDSDELRQRLARFAANGKPANAAEDFSSSAHGPLRTLLLDATLGDQFGWNAAEAPELEVLATASDLDGFMRAIPRDGADVVVLHLSLLGEDPLDGLVACLDASEARIAVVLYEFASRKLLSQLAARGARLIRGPVSVAQLRRAIIDVSVIQQAGRKRGGLEEDGAVALHSSERIEPPARHFSSAQLARLREVSSTVDCECPNHLAGIVTSLLAFEDYSSQCENATPNDAELHGSLRRATGHARALMERMIVRICDQDGIHI